jgi:uncharacterized membrane protein YphA (DoxX/SURF4 family)
MKFVISTGAFPATIFIRLMLGAIFMSEGIQKWLLPMTRGEGRFLQIGLPSPEILGYLVGGFELVCGICIVVGLATRLAAVPLITIMIVALITTKLPVLSTSSFWEFAHLARIEFALLMSSLFLLIRGGGLWSLDNAIERRRIKREIYGAVSEESAAS